ncbi:MAG TPA: FAD-binding protein [Acidobacteriaceae bacterium]|jgi:L-aspartate oxidase|nr:FAD-binding protein [Acidobacteriaceae bacterium]
MAEVQETEFLIVGAGIAGLRAAIGLALDGARVLVVTKEALGESNTNYAQGGIAVAMSGEEDVALHLDDTVNAGDRLGDREAARVLVEEGPLRVEELLRWGTDFDREGGRLMLTREGAHSCNRILHAQGDATGAEIGRSLLRQARSMPKITLREWTTTVGLTIEDGSTVGVKLLDKDGELSQVRAQAVLLASGGAGQVYSDTTNPAVATGDGIAMAFRAGAEIADMEFYQFHPTALSLPNVPRFLLSEALRGEGAYLRNARGERFMERYHPLLELASRDVVARAITREGMGATDEALPVYLDMRHVTKTDPATRFPGISRFLGQHGLDLRRDLIPVRPAAHYLMGGVRRDVHGRTSLPRLYAAGEVACTGVPTGWRAIHCSKGWYSGRERLKPCPRRRPSVHILPRLRRYWHLCRTLPAFGRVFNDRCGRMPDYSGMRRVWRLRWSRYGQSSAKIQWGPAVHWWSCGIS